MARILDGKKTADEIRSELRTAIEALKSNGCTPRLTVVLVGDNAASRIYVNMKTRACDAIGLASDTISMPAETGQAELLGVIEGLNTNSAVHGILVQLPLPSHIDEDTILQSVSPDKDVDGFHPINRGKLVMGMDTFLPCTPFGVQQLLLRNGIEISGKHVVIVGRSNIVGMPLSTMLLQKQAGANATVTVCHTGTKDLASFTKQADILVAAVGRPEVITGWMVKEGVIVVDVGVNRVDDPDSEKGYRVVGDVEFASVSLKARAISPVPGGVGPMTIAMLIYNTVKAAKQICASSSIG